MSKIFKNKNSLSSRRKPGSCYLTPQDPGFRRGDRDGERGNMLFMILIAVALIGLLTAAIMGSSHTESASIDKETLAIRASEVQRHAAEYERAVMFITNNGKSESAIRFAHPAASSDYGDLGADTDKTDEVFAPEGGGATYHEPPAGINDGSKWEFYGGTAVPGAGSSRADLVAVLPNVTQQFCDKINDLNGQPHTLTDTGTGAAGGSSPGDCIYGGAAARFGDTHQFYNSPNTMNEATFTQNPNSGAAGTALEACVKCSIDGQNHFYHVLMSR